MGKNTEAFFLRRQERLSEKSIRTYYQKEAAVYDARFNKSQGRYGDYRQRKKVLEFVGSCKGKRILEIGSGTGRFSRELARNGAQVFCVDLSRNMHNQARLLSSYRDSSYFVMKGGSLGFSDETFDACVAINVMSHIKNDFESTVFPEYPELKKIKEELYNTGALYASLSGSGSSLYGIFSFSPEIPKKLKNYFIRQYKI